MEHLRQDGSLAAGYFCANCGQPCGIMGHLGEKDYSCTPNPTLVDQLRKINEGPSGMQWLGDHVGVHQSHCCKAHGCKYGDSDCPVVSGQIVQDYPCEMCDIEKEERKQATINIGLQMLEGLPDAHVVLRSPGPEGLYTVLRMRGLLENGDERAIAWVNDILRSTRDMIAKGELRNE